MSPLDSTSGPKIEIIGPKDMSVVRTPKSEVVAPPTEELYLTLQKAFDHFNATLFGDRLPSCLITLQRQSRTLGYYSARKFAALQGDARVDEIDLNPQHFRERTAEDTASTLVHEMVHLAQQHFGKSPKKGYHDREWAAWMKRIGLYPSSTGAFGGKETGHHMDHFIIPDGPFAVAYAMFEQTGATIGWGDAMRLSGNKLVKPKRLKFICPAARPTFTAFRQPVSPARCANWRWCRDHLRHWYRKESTVIHAFFVQIEATPHHPAREVLLEACCQLLAAADPLYPASGVFTLRCNPLERDGIDPMLPTLVVSGKDVR